MELVKGTSITEFVSSKRLPVSERLQLFHLVCDAVQHAHQKGIIHRDLKPSNILVTLHDGVPVPKVIDFGIAKAINHLRLTEKTLFTSYASMIGTPQYMSPEQAELNGLDVDTRSDIYSLGVLLYELVTGTTPLSREELKNISPYQLHETLREAEIETPSSRVLNSDEATPALISDSEGIKKGQFGELDWVVMKALSRNRNDRYASANELASDINRYLKNEPVMAAAPSRFRKLSAFVRRNRRSLFVALSISLLLLAFSITCLLLALQVIRSNGLLTSTNKKLSDNIEQLEEAEAKVLEAAHRQKYEAAISIAMVKFEMEVFRTYEKELNELTGLSEVPMSKPAAVQSDSDRANEIEEEPEF